MSKPKEFWLEENDLKDEVGFHEDEGPRFSVTVYTEFKKKFNIGLIHVIEKKAYDDLEAEIAKLQAQVYVLKDNSLRSYDGLAQKADKASRLEEAFEYLVSMLPEECTAGFVTHARAIISGDLEEIEKTK